MTDTLAIKPVTNGFILTRGELQWVARDREEMLFVVRTQVWRQHPQERPTLGAEGLRDCGQDGMGDVG